MRRGKTRAGDLQATERRAYVYRLREAGASYAQIAQTILIDPRWISRLPKGYDERFAYRDVMAELTKYREELKELSDTVRQQELLRIDRMLMAIWTRALGSNDIPADLYAMDRVMTLMTLRVRIVPGLAAPQKIAPTTPDGTEPYASGQAEPSGPTEEFWTSLAELFATLGPQHAVVSLPGDDGLPMALPGENGTHGTNGTAPAGD